MQTGNQGVMAGELQFNELICNTRWNITHTGDIISPRFSRSFVVSEKAQEITMMRLIKAIFVIAMMLMLTGCVVAPPYHRAGYDGGYHHGHYYRGYPHRGW
uniref:Uncharacterized protein n=1 Tax=Erwinia amylovora ATCC BAA-2158 TaxID=889211 RepID=E5B794_ERWAM|nr:hypothetical protein predicted by Glimmer/Critica [Erwinia amylovora ATCC BAA-2158]